MPGQMEWQELRIYYLTISYISRLMSYLADKIYSPSDSLLREKIRRGIYLAVCIGGRV